MAGLEKLKDSSDTKIALIGNNIEYIQRDIQEIKTSIKEISGVYVTKQEFLDFKNSDFATVRKLVYGAVALILSAVVGGIMVLVIQK